MLHTVHVVVEHSSSQRVRLVPVQRVLIHDIITVIEWSGVNVDNTEPLS